ncbi:MAG: DUF4038 domain-containing protein [Phyllobacterium sp.]|uniref:apiosidase-like domain-containing protein n=1 Tax=Phyllobacterium sp. TaxID=1871046 RepID=UPI0030F1AE15
MAENNRYLEDAAGRPFLITGDAAWSLIGDLSREDADKYLADRQRRGFNTILVSLIEHQFSRNAPRNFYKRQPFLPNGAFSKPNDAYFADADWILERARERGFLVLLAPAYMGANGGGQGWFSEMVAAGPYALKSYGRYLAQRYRNFRNIVWVHGGDYDPPDKTLVNAVAEGIREIDPDAIQTMHAGRDTDVASIWRGENWLKFDTVYTYGDVAAATLKRYRDGPARPYIFIEGIYEGEHHSTEQTIRGIAYGALLSGASGQVFGNNPIWHFAGPSLFEQPTNWQEALASRGAQSITHLKTLFDSLAWWTLKPEQGKLLVNLDPPLPGYAIGSLSADGKLAMIYVADRGAAVLSTAQLASTTPTARWVDPSSGQYSEAATEKTDRPDVIRFRVPRSQNSAGFFDWVLVLTTDRD